MAKRVKQDSTYVPQVTFTLPEGFVDQTSELIGFWADDAQQSPIQGIPRHVIAHDSHLDPSKPSYLIVVELTATSSMVDPDGERIVVEPGKYVGLYYKPGMAAILELADVEVWMVLTGERDVGKASPMKVYRVASKGRGAALKVKKDYRKTSRAVQTPFATPEPEYDPPTFE